MITEFVGPPGSGKSTTARKLAARHGGQVLKLNGFAYGSSLGRVEPVLTQPRLMVAASRLDWRLAINLCRRSRLVSDLPPGGRLWIEDGPLYALSRMITGDAPQLLISRVVRRLNLPDRCVVMRTSVAICLYRLQHLRRDHKRFAGMEPSRAIPILDELMRATDRLVECLPAHVEVTQLDNDETTSPASDPIEF